MKMKPEHFSHLKQAIEKVLQENPDVVEKYETGKFLRSDKVKDLQTRFNFDLFHVSGQNQWACDVLYKYLNDSHIETALNQICPKITKRY